VVRPSPQHLSRGNVALSSTTTDRPARASVIAAAEPAGPAPITTTSALAARGGSATALLTADRLRPAPSDPAADSRAPMVGYFVSSGISCGVWVLQIPDTRDFSRGDSRGGWRWRRGRCACGADAWRSPVPATPAAARRPGRPGTPWRWCRGGRRSSTW